MKTKHAKHTKAFIVGIILNVGFVIIEVIFGLRSNSSALLADAGHNASDVLSLVFAWMAVYFSTKKPKKEFTYGLGRVTILVSLLNAMLLFAAVFFIVREAVQKFNQPTNIEGNTIIIVALIGTAINTITALLFMKGKERDLNIKGAFLHMAADAGVSLGVVIGGIIIKSTGVLWIDPVLSLLIAIIILWSTIKLFMEGFNLAVDAVPKGININEVYKYLLSKPDVKDVHDLHIRAMSTTDYTLTAHLVMPKGNSDEFLEMVNKELSEKFNIDHVTIQIEIDKLRNNHYHVHS